MTKVYLSSTLLDLRDERQAVTNWLIAAGFQPVHSYVADSESVRAEQLLRTQEDRAAQDAAAQWREAAELAREIAALATGRDSAAALAALERVVTYLPDDYRAHGELGDALMVVGRTDSALDHYQTALRLGLELVARDPANAEWQRDLIVSHVKIAEVGGGGDRCLA